MKIIVKIPDSYIEKMKIKYFEDREKYNINKRIFSSVGCHGMAIFPTLEQWLRDNIKGDIWKLLSDEKGDENANKRKTD